MSTLTKGYIALAVVYLAWGTTFGAMHLGLQDIPPFVFAVQRFFIAGALMILIALANGEALPDRASIKRNVIAGICLFVFGNGITFWTLQYMTTSVAGLLVALHPFWMLGLTSVLPPREKISPMALLGLAVGFAGLAILLLPELMTPQKLHPMFGMCLLLTVFTGFSWAMGSIYTRKNHVKASVLMSVGIQNFASALILLPVAYMTGGDPFVLPNAHGAGALAYLIVVGSLIGMTCYQYTMETLPVALSSTFAYVTPLITMLVGWMFLGETVSPLMLVGAFVILVGVGIVQTSARKVVKRESVIEAVLVSKKTVDERVKVS